MTTVVVVTRNNKDMIQDATMKIVDGIKVITEDTAATFQTIDNIVVGKDGVIGIVIIVITTTDTKEDVITMTTEETLCLSTVKTTEIVPPVSRSEFISKVPCNKCLMFVMCRRRMTNSVISFAHSKYGCPEAKEFVMAVDQDGINAMRILFDLQAYP